MLLICYNFEIYVLMKILNFWLEFCLPIIISIFLIMIALGFDHNIIIDSTKVAIPTTLAICSISFLCGCFNIASKRASLLAILALPMIAPIIMLAIKFNIETSILLSLFLLAVNTFSSSKIIKIVSQ